MKAFKKRKPLFIILLILCLVTVDIVISKTKANGSVPAVDSFFFESGDNQIDGYTAASIKTHVAIVKSDNPGLSFSKGSTEPLSTDQIREMVFLALETDKHYGTDIPELKYKINQIGSDARVSLMPNIVFYPGNRYMVGDQTDPRITWAVLDYIADSTNAKRIGLLAGGSYQSYAGETDIFERSQFGTRRWNEFFTDLSDNFTLKSIVDAAQARHPGKTIECINTNYNEIMNDGRPYNEIPSAQLPGMTPRRYPVPVDPNGVNPQIGNGFSTANFIADSGYNPTDAILNCDILVNIPVLKTTADVVINCVFKNYIGSVSRGVYAVGSTYPTPRGDALMGLDHGKLVNTVLNLFSYRPSDYCVIDALASLEGEGSHPWGDHTGFLRRNLIIAGGDPVACEATACATMKINPNDVEHLRWAYAQGYGYYDLRRIAVYGDSLSSVQTDFKAPANHTSNNYIGFKGNHYRGRGCRRWLLNGPYSAADIHTTHLNEQDADPRPGDIENSKPWTAYYSPESYIDLTTALSGTENNSVAYAFTQIYSDRAQSGLLYVGGVRDVMVYVNGSVMVDTSFLSYSDVGAVKPVSLSKGDNRILVKIRRSGSTYVFSLGVVNDGATASRNSYVPHRLYYSRNQPLGNPISLTDEMKRSFFGGRTLFNTFYHLGQSEPQGTEQAGASGNGFELGKNMPNPFNSMTKIDFFISRTNVPVEMIICDVRGALVTRLFSSKSVYGARTVFWNATDLTGKKVPSGIYILRLRAGSLTKTRQMAYIR
jgi:hypothetical protein